MSRAAVHPREGFTEDRIYGGKVVLRQPQRGYRVAIDPVLLASSVPVRPGDRVLDVGVGTGAVSLCLAARTPDLQISGIDSEPGFLSLARQSAALNGVTLDLHELDVLAAGRRPPPVLTGGFDHVVTNPPFWEDGKGRRPIRASVASASRMPTGALANWTLFCAACLAEAGTLSMILPWTRLDEALSAVAEIGFSARVLPLVPRDEIPPRRAILQACASASPGVSVLPPVPLHDLDGHYTGPIDDVLRGRRGLALRRGGKI